MGWQARLAEMLISARGTKRDYGTAAGTEAKVAEQLLRPRRFSPPKPTVRKLSVTVRHEGTMPVYTVGPGAGQPSARVVFFHGGGYAFEIDPAHWWFVGRLVRATGAAVEVPIYPLAPVSTAVDTVPLATDLVEHAVSHGDGLPTTVMGDSAGGGLSLAVCQSLRERGASQPDRLVLISPWLDVTVSDPRQPGIEAHDRMLGIEGARQCGRTYAGTLDRRDPRVSPIFGDVSGLPRTDVFTGTYDILNPDAHALAERCAEAGQPIRLHEAPGMQHDYPLFPLVPESVAARAEIASIVLGQDPTEPVG